MAKEAKKLTKAKKRRHKIQEKRSSAKGLKLELTKGDRRLGKLQIGVMIAVVILAMVFVIAKVR